VSELVLIPAYQSDSHMITMSIGWWGGWVETSGWRWCGVAQQPGPLFLGPRRSSPCPETTCVICAPSTGAWRRWARPSSGDWQRPYPVHRKNMYGYAKFPIGLTVHTHQGRPARVKYDECIIVKIMEAKNVNETKTRKFCANRGKIYKFCGNS